METLSQKAAVGSGCEPFQPPKPNYVRTASSAGGQGPLDMLCHRQLAGEALSRPSPMPGGGDAPAAAKAPALPRAALRGPSGRVCSELAEVLFPQFGAQRTPTG